jgi:hypothetical protein
VKIELLCEIESSEDGSESLFFGVPPQMFPGGLVVVVVVVFFFLLFFVLSAKHVQYELNLSCKIVFPGGAKNVKITCDDETIEEAESKVIFFFFFFFLFCFFFFFLLDGFFFFENF